MAGINSGLCAVLDLAARFANGSLSTRTLLEADDEELHRILTEVRGIGVVSILVSSDHVVNELTNRSP